MSNIRFERKSYEGENFYRSENAEAHKVCQQEEIGRKIQNHFEIKEQEMSSLKSKFGHRVIVLEQDYAIETEQFRIYQEELTKRWVGIILNKDGSERQPYYCHSTKYKVLYEMLAETVEKTWE
jgi:hypothetical protein